MNTQNNEYSKGQERLCNLTEPTSMRQIGSNFAMSFQARTHLKDDDMNTQNNEYSKGQERLCNLTEPTSM